MKPFIILLLILGITGCDGQPLPEKKWGIDQCARREVFEQCMRLLPAGPAATKYNDWDEVVEACGDQAYRHATRAKTQIPAQCADE